MVLFRRRLDNACCNGYLTRPKCFIFATECPDDTFKRIPINPFPGKRSVLFSWSHNHDPEDVGVALQVTGVTSEKRLNITVQEYAVHGLGMKMNHIYIIRSHSCS